MTAGFNDTISIPASLIIDVSTISLTGTTLTIDCASRKGAEMVYNCLVEGAPNATAVMQGTSDVFHDLGLSEPHG